MERLTFRTDGMSAFSDRNISTYGGIRKDGTVIHIGAVANKLAAYEDTNLTPEQIAEMDKLYLAKCQEVNRLNAELSEQNKNNGWIPCSERYPDNDNYILISLENFSIPIVGRYEENENGGAFYVGDESETCVSQVLFVNAWQPLPEPYMEVENG